MITKAMAHLFLPPPASAEVIFKIEHWNAPNQYRYQWERSKCKLYENRKKANAGMANTCWGGEAVRILFALQDGDWVEVSREIDEFLK